MDYIFKLVGLQLFPETCVNIRKTLLPGWYPFLSCSNDIGTDDSLIPELSDVSCPDGFFRITDSSDMPYINVSAIVGKNGSGKSSIVNIVLAVVNNLVCELINQGYVEIAIKPQVAYGIRARLYYYVGNDMQLIDVNDRHVELGQIINGVICYRQWQGNSYDEIKEILENLFYTISLNYSLYAPVQSENYNWLYSLADSSNDSNLPIVLAPYRDKDGTIRVDYENRLASRRLSVLSILFQAQGLSFVEGYRVTCLTYNLNSGYVWAKIEQLRNTVCPKELRDCMDLILKSIGKSWSNILKEHKLKTHEDKEYQTIEILYLEYKTMDIICQSPYYRKQFGLDELCQQSQHKRSRHRELYYGRHFVRDDNGTIVDSVEDGVAKKWLQRNVARIDDVVSDLFKGQGNKYVLDIHHFLTYLSKDRYKDYQGTIAIDSIIGIGVNDDYDCIKKILPPDFIDYELHLTSMDSNANGDETMTFNSMSSGERHLWYSMSYVFYHMYQLFYNNTHFASNLFLIFDEVELYYHPEFQRQYLLKLLEKLKNSNLGYLVKGVNVLLVTHSPYLLSDIPTTNVLYLPQDNNNSHGKTLGGNIYDLLKDSFFLKSSIGSFSEMKLKEILDVFNDNDAQRRKDLFIEKRELFRFIVSQLGEEYLFNAFNYMVGEMEKEYMATDSEYISAKISRLENELSSLKRSQIKKCSHLNSI